MMRNRVGLASSGHLAAWPVIELMAAIAAQLVLTPFLLHRLSTQQFGIWVIAQSALLASATLSLGAGTALLPVLSGAKSREDAVGAWSAIRLFVKRTSLVSLATLGAVVLAIGAHGAPGWTPGLGRYQFLALASVTLAWVAATELDAGLSSALKALGRFHTVAQMELASRAAQVALTLWHVAADTSALVPISVAAAMTAAKAVWKFAALRKHWPLPDHGSNQSHDANDANAISRELRSAGAWAWLGVVSGLMFNAFDRWFIGAWLGSSVLAPYAVCSQIAQIPHAVVSAAGQTLVPWAARHRADLADAGVRRGARKLMVLATMAAALPSVLLLLLLEPLLSLWMSKEFALDHLRLASGMTFVFLLLSLNVPSYFMLFGFGQIRVSTILVGIAGVVFVAGCLLMSPSLMGFVAMKGVFAVLTLGLVAQLLWLSRAPR